MALSVQELWYPRFKVMRDFPGNPHPVGHILEYSKDDEWDQKQMATCLKYPEIFRRLEWWQNREYNELPEYVRWTATERMGRIQKARYDLGINSIFLDGNEMTFSMWIVGLVPATETEYNDYLQSLKQLK